MARMDKINDIDC